MKFKLKDSIMVNCRIGGRHKRVREVSAFLDFNYYYSCMNRRAALDLYFPEVASARPEDWAALNPDQVPTILGFRGIEKGILITLPEVSVGKLSCKDIKAIILGLDIPVRLPADIILGQNFLRNFRLTIDGRAGYFSLT